MHIQERDPAALHTRQRCRVQLLCAPGALRAVGVVDDLPPSAAVFVIALAIAAANRFAVHRAPQHEIALESTTRPAAARRSVRCTASGETKYMLNTPAVRVGGVVLARDTALRSHPGRSWPIPHSAWSRDNSARAASGPWSNCFTIAPFGSRR